MIGIEVVRVVEGWHEDGVIRMSLDEIHDGLMLRLLAFLLL